MQSIGERLEEARKRRGISVREASEATKIRGDFLLSFENNQFDVGLPEIYVRGFLRNYATFLKVDGEKLVTDYSATQIGESKAARKEPRELFGRLELPERQRTNNDGGAAAAAATPAHPPAQRRHHEDAPDSTFRDGSGSGPDVMLYAKFGGVIAAGIIAILLIVWLFKAIISSPSGTADAERPNGPTTTQSAPAATGTITLIALDTVRVKVTQVNDKTVIFDGGLARGETKTLTRSGPVVVVYDNGRNLNVETDGKRFSIPRDGIGKTTFQ